VVLLETNDSNGQALSLGSGFFISNSVIATNAHVIGGASSGSVKLAGGSRKMQILGTIAVDAHADLALLRVDGSAPPLTLGSSTSLAVGDNVYVVGNPLGLEGTFSEGIISAVRKMGTDSILQMTAPISPGSSGGPVMDSAGAVIGISVATFQYGQNLNLAVPVSYLLKLVATESQVPTPLGNGKIADHGAGSLVDSLGTRAENGVAVTNYHLRLDDQGLGDYGEYSFRLTNKLPVEISDPRLLILYDDESGALMDFENYAFAGRIPAGLTKTVVIDVGTEESRRAALYYGNKKIAPKVEIRVISFREEASQ
jgi:hypothetical protein